ncbi:MAG: BamA/TamA family outer membrane protein [Candidatus Zixiibacteriota bacterium]|nr:MAG: BamA/TamA family outer membrane protein [candidate division Zixibacteria bacterium]
MFGLTRYLRFGFSAVFFLTIIISSFGFFDAHCSEAYDNPVGDSTESDAGYPRKVSSKATWEKIVSFPGAVVFFPFQVVYAVTEKAFGTEYEVPLVGKIADLMASDDGRRSLYPTYGSRRGGGLKYKHKGLLSRGSVFDITTTAWIRNRSMYRIRFRDVDIIGGVASTGFTVRYMLMPDEKFYGLGMDSEKDDKSNFSWEQTSIELSLGKRFLDRLKSNITLAYQRNNILPGRDRSIPLTSDIYNSRTLPGLESGVELMGGNFEVTYDSKNHPGRPTGGWEIFINGGYQLQTRDDDFEYLESSMDITRYVHLFYNRYMVFRAAARTARPFSGKKVPFYHLSQMGLWSTVRGFSRGRFRDRDLVMGSLEYRWPLTPNYLHALIFVDAGKVSLDIFENISEGDYEISYGVGLIGWSHEGILIRAEIGKSSDQIRFNLNFN